MPYRVVRFSKALWMETAKRIPYILLVFVVVWSITTYIRFRQLAETTQATKNLTSKVVSVSQDIQALAEQNRALTRQNIQLAQENAQQINCISHVFTDFINDGGQPSRADIDNCQSVLIPQALNGQPPPKAGQATAPTPQSQSKSHPSPSSSSHSAQHPSPSSRPSQPPGIIKQVLNFLGL